ncbi:reverse transcriptase domain-containing protein [Tanacetum coccineum]
MRQRFPEPLALLANTYNPPPLYNSHQTQYQAQPSEVYQPYQHYQSSTPITQQLIQLPSLQSYAPLVVQQPPTFQLDTGLAIPTFLPIDDPIASLNKAMINNQASGAWVINAVGNTGANQPRVIRCYNCKGEGHMAKQCTIRKRVKYSEWFKDKILLAQAQEAGVILDEEQQDFLANSLEETDDYCNDEATSNTIFMVNLSPVGSLNDDMVAPRYDSDTLSEVPYYDTYHDSDVLNFNIQELEYIENIVSNNDSYDTFKGNNNVISYTDYMLTNGDDADNYVPPHIQKNDMMLSSQSFKYAVKDGHSEQEAYLKQLYWSSIPSPPVTVSKPKVFPKKLLSTSQVLRNLNKAQDLLTKFDECIKRRTTLSPHEIGSWEQSDIKGFIAEVKEMKDIFEQMEDKVDQCFVLKLVTFKFKKMSTRSRLLLDQWKIPSYYIVHDGSLRDARLILCSPVGSCLA